MIISDCVYIYIYIFIFFFFFLHWPLRQLRICLQCGRLVFDPWVRKILWRREWQPTAVFLPGKFYGERSLAGYMGLQRVGPDWATDTFTFTHCYLDVFISVSHILKCEPEWEISVLKACGSSSCHGSQHTTGTWVKKTWTVCVIWPSSEPPLEGTGSSVRLEALEVFHRHRVRTVWESTWTQAWTSVFHPGRRTESRCSY